jgi:hypothetical protein
MRNAEYRDLFSRKQNLNLLFPILDWETPPYFDEFSFEKKEEEEEDEDNKK